MEVKFAQLCCADTVVELLEVGFARAEGGCNKIDKASLFVSIVKGHLVRWCEASVGAGTPCKGNLMETTGCQPKVVNCEMSDWSEWAE
eukprot:349318-Amphidinium_carterae.1